MVRWSLYELFVGFGLILMGPVDFVTTFLLVEQFGVGLEVNPVMRFAFSHSVLAALVIKGVQLSLLVGLFYWFRKLVVDSKRTDEEYQVQLCFRVTVLVFVVWSIFVAGNNSIKLLPILG